MSELGMPQQPLEHHNFVHPYSAACLMVFAIVGIVLQVPVIYTHCGLFSRTNIPVIMMSIFYMYIMASSTVSASYWHDSDPTLWWDGRGWCDVDVRLSMAISLGVLSSQCVINWNIVELLSERPRLIFGRRAYIRGGIEFACCVFLPVINLAISTFFMENRYIIAQDLGCLVSTDTSVAVIMTYFMWIPILGAIALFEMVLIGYRFWRRGKELAMETMCFMPFMNTAQFIRILLFSAVVTGIFVPLIICVAAINFINIREAGVHDIAWAHGKPGAWNTIARVTMAEVSALGSGNSRASFIINFVTRYINIAIAWLLFICYGTGSLAAQAYKTAYHKLLGAKSDGVPFPDDIDDHPGKENDDSRFSFKSSCHEWDADLDGRKAMKHWESRFFETDLDYTPPSSCALSSPESANSRTGLIPPNSPAQPVSNARRPEFPLGRLLAGENLPLPR